MIVNDLIRELEKARDLGYSDAEVNVIHATSGELSHKASGKFPLLAVNTEHGVNLVQSNYCVGYVPLVCEDVKRPI